MPRADRASNFWRRLSATGLACFVAAACALHLLRPELDPIHSQMSLYLVGPWGGVLQVAYVALGVAMVALAWDLRQSAEASARSAAPLLMFVLGAICLSTTACARTDMPGVDAGLEGLVHGITASGAFLFTTTGIVLQAMRLRRDQRWRPHLRWLLAWALAAFVGIRVLALCRELPRGLAQKTVIALIVGWLATVALLRLRSPTAPPQGPRPRGSGETGTATDSRNASPDP